MPSLENCNYIDEVFAVASEAWREELLTDLRILKAKQDAMKNCGCSQCQHLFSQEYIHMAKKWKKHE